MAQIEQSDKGKKKKGAQKKMAIHVDFTPMVDMNMLLITFFMLCTTMIKSQTLSIVLPSNKQTDDKNKTEAKASETITMILDTEYDENGAPKFDAEHNKTVHHVYWYKGEPDTINYQTSSDPFKNFLNVESFTGNENGERRGIRAILYSQNEEVMKNYAELKQQWKDKKITDEEFKEKAKANAADSTLKRPVVIIKPGPNTTYEGLINAIDEMNINQISRYSIQMPDHIDTLLLERYQATHPGTTVIRPMVRDKK